MKNIQVKTQSFHSFFYSFIFLIEEEKILFGNDEKILKIGDEENKNIQEFTGSPQFLYEKKTKIFCKENEFKRNEFIL